MATFTLNSKKTFVQSSATKGIFDKAFAFSIFLIVIVGGIWATERILIYLADKQIEEYQETTNASFAAVSTEDSQVVHDITSRIAAIQKHGTATMNPADVLAALERSTIPQAKLTEFEYKKDGTVTMSGTVADFRFLAEQILRYRQEELFASTEVQSTDRTESGQITFSLFIDPATLQEKTPAPSNVPTLPLVMPPQT